ncbi:hypothetical protein N9H70_07090, partial [Pseudomonadales bacterium]|nr:hypothetical protein [Pseudomonadales bacterium]
MVRSLLLVLSTALIASCGGGGGSTQDGGPAGFAPTLSVNGTKVGTQPVVVTVDENTTEVAVVASTGGTLSVSEDNDGSLFILAADGQLSFIDAPDFENPGGDGSNGYTVRVDATGGISTAVTLTVQVNDIAEGSVIDGRVVDGPVKAADVYADMNCNGIQDENEKPFAETDDDGFFEIQTDAELTDGCNGKFFSIGGTDTVTNKALANIQLSADLPTKVAAVDETGAPILNPDGTLKQVFPKVVVTPLSTIIAAATTPEAKNATLKALGLGNVSIQEALTLDPWSGSQSDDTSDVGLAASKIAQSIQRANTQIATIIKVAASTAQTGEAGAQTAESLETAVQAVSNAIVKQAVAAAAEEAATGVPTRVNLASADVIADVIEDTVTEVVIKAEVKKALAANPGQTEEQARAAAVIVAAVRVAQVQAVITSISNTVELVNTSAADESVNPTSEVGLAVANATQTAVVDQVDATVAAVKAVLEDDTKTAADLEVLVTAEVIKVSEITNEVILDAVVDAVSDAGGDGDEVKAALPDFDEDGIPNITDPDDDNDGVNDGKDVFPLDETEILDTDGDGIGNNKDADDDGDGVLDDNDAFLLDPKESVDTDTDGIGNNADTDD